MWQPHWLSTGKSGCQPFGGWSENSIHRTEEGAATLVPACQSVLAAQRSQDGLVQERTKKPAALDKREAGSVFYIGLICLWPFSILQHPCGACILHWEQCSENSTGTVLCILSPGPFDITRGGEFGRMCCLYLAKCTSTKVNSFWGKVSHTLVDYGTYNLVEMQLETTLAATPTAKFGKCWHSCFQKESRPAFFFCRSSRKLSYSSGDISFARASAVLQKSRIFRSCKTFACPSTDRPSMQIALGVATVALLSNCPFPLTFALRWTVDYVRNSFEWSKLHTGVFFRSPDTSRRSKRRQLRSEEALLQRLP